MLSLTRTALVLSLSMAAWSQIDQGPGGPILVLSHSANPFSRYYAEILRNEGFNEFLVADIATVSAGTLAAYDLVILGDMPLSAGQATMLTGYVSAGGNLIAMRPDKQLAGLLGLSDAGGTLSEGYLLINTSTAPGAGIVGQTIQFHGTADRYAVSGATVVATLYATATGATSHPAVTLRAFGGGQAASFVYDLARSVVYTRQGNPAWAGVARYHSGAPFPADLFYPGWTDTTKTHIPQADEQMRLLSNMIQHMNRLKKPLPRFWYLPFNKKFALIMTSDDHGPNGTVGRFNGFNSLSPGGCSVANWECVRATAYVFPNHPGGLTAYQAQGHEISLHFSAPSYYTPASVDSALFTQINQFRAAFPSLNPPVSERGHGGPQWNDYASQAVAEAKHGIRLDHNFIQDPYGYYNANAGFFTGSAMLMRFADGAGSMIDTYQAPTQVYDANGSNIPTWAYPILDRGVGAEGFYGFASVLIHSDYSWQDSSAFTLASAALARGVPVITSRQAVTWLDGRNNSAFSAIGWTGSRLNFNVTAAAGSNGLRGMLPMNSTAGVLNSILQNGSAIAFTTQTVKGVDYAFFAATTAAYQAVYGSGGPPPPVVTAVSPIGSSVSTATAVMANFSAAMNPASFNSSTFTLRPNSSSVNVPASVSASGASATLVPTGALAPATTYIATISGSVTSSLGAALGSSYAWTFTTAAAAAVPPTVASVNPNGAGVPIPSAVTVTFSQVMNAGSFGSSTAGLYNGGTQLSAVLSLSGSVLTITPSSALAAGATYNVVIAGSVTNSTGVPLGSAFNSSFTTAAVSSSGGLAGWWQFNEGGGATALDATGRGNTLALNGAAWTSGYSGAGLAVTAGAGIASLTNPSSVLNNHTAFTWAAWVRPTGEMGRGLGPVIERGTGSDTRRTLSFGPVASSSPRTVSGSVRAATNAFSESQIDAYSLNTWAHWAMTYNDAGDRRIHIYRNGVEVAYRAQVPASGALVGDAGSGLGVGATPGSQFFGFTGTIDDVRIYDRVLTPGELLALVGAVVPPSVIANAPTGTGVSTGLPVTATFSRAMNAASFHAATFRLRANGASSDVPAATGVSGATATLSPLSALAAGTTYTATIAASVTDTGSVALGSDYSWSFTTAVVPPPLVTSWSPTGAGASLSPAVTVSFNRSMAAATFSGSSFTLRANGSSSDVPASISLAGSTATLTPLVTLAANTTYTASVSPSVTDTGGIPLGSNFTWTFTTAAGGPAPIAWWRLNESGGASVSDSSGNGSTGTAINTAWTSGHTGSALSFNGASSVVNLGSPTVLTNLRSFTWSVWVAPAGEMGRAIGPVIEKGTGSFVAKSFSFGAVASSTPRTVLASVRAGSVEAVAESVIGSYDVGVWAHWAVTYDDVGDRRLRIYKNGVEVSYRTQTAAVGAIAPDAGVNLALGSSPGTQFFAFNGALDDVRIFNRALTAAEIQAIAAQ